MSRLHIFFQFRHILGPIILFCICPAQNPLQITDNDFVNYMPSLIQTQTGRFMIVYEQLDSGFGSGDLLVTISSDGILWSEPEPIVSGPGNDRHPSLIQLNDGSFQVYYLSDISGGYRIRMAWSENGTDWMDAGDVDLGWPQSTQTINPTVILESDGSLTMSYDILYGGGYVSHSADGASWSEDHTWVSSGALNRIMRHQNGTYLLSYQQQTGSQYYQIDLFTRTSQNLTDWTPENQVTSNLNSHDSFPIQLADGEYGLFYARSDNNAPYDLVRLASDDGLNWDDQEYLFPDPGWDTQPHPILTADGDIALAWARGPSQNTTEVFFVLIPGTGSDCDETPGDVNADGIINVLDIISIINFILGLSDPTECQFSAADMNGDQTLDILDIILIVNVII